MISILAVFPVDWSRAATLGLVEKSTGLVDAARAQGFAVDAVFPEGESLRWYRPGDLPPHGMQAANSIVDRVRAYREAHFRYSGFWRKLNEAALPPYDFVWVRAFPASRRQHSWLANVRSRGARVVYDLPTYPTSAENRSALRRLFLRSSIALDELAEHIDAIVTLSEDVQIAGRNVIRVRNGVSVPALARDWDLRAGPFRLLGLGQWAYWHGLDRLFEGLAQAEGLGQWRLRLAGEGPAVEGLRRLAAELAVDVEWLPPAYGPARRTLLDWADVGIGCLAIHRKGVFPDQSLKHRQYAAAGLPFVATTADPLWRGVEGVWSLPSSEAPVDARDLLHFCERARESAARHSTELRSKAREASWDLAYRNLWNYFADGI